MEQNCVYYDGDQICITIPRRLYETVNSFPYTFTCLSALAGYRQPSFNHRRIMRLDSTDILYIRPQLISIRFC